LLVNGFSVVNQLVINLPNIKCCHNEFQVFEQAVQSRQ